MTRRSLARRWSALSWLYHGGGPRQNALGDVDPELLRRLEVDREIHFPRRRGRNFGCGLAAEDGLGELARLAADVLAAGERQREKGPHLGMTLGNPEHGNLLPIREEQHLLHHGLGKRRLVGQDPESIDPILKGVQRSHRFLWGGDLLRDEL